MAAYKVPQDVEAEDKLIGPFSFRQFIYLIIVVISGFAAYLLAQIFIGLLIIPIPIILFFGALALPLKKDQPMETYLAAVVRFFLKPKKRIWQSEGSINLVEIVAPRVVETQRYRDLSQDEAQDRFDYLARVMDSRGWSTKGVMSANDSLSDIVTAEATQATDILDDTNTFAQSLETRLETREHQRIQEVVDKMHQPQPEAASNQSATSALPPLQATIPAATPFPISQTPIPNYDPYPTNMHQRIIPTGDEPVAVDNSLKMVDGGGVVTDTSQPAAQPSSDGHLPPTTPDPMVSGVSPDILKLANNPDLSISAIAHEAQRLKDRHDSEEVIIPLR